MEKITDPAIMAAWESAHEQLGGHLYEIHEGEVNVALLVRETPHGNFPDYVVKVPKANWPGITDTVDGSKYSAYEAAIVQCMNESPLEPPVHVPQLLGKSKPSDPAWAAFSFVPGEVLSYRQIRERFSDAEIQRFSRTIGNLASWFSKAVSFDAYTALNPPQPFNKERICLTAAERAIALNRTTHPRVQHLGDLVKGDYEFLQEYGALGPPNMMGHDDLRPGNLTFAHSNGQWRLWGAFDFGIARPTTASREVRHMYLFGVRVGQIALEQCADRSPHTRVSSSSEAYITLDDIARQWALMQAHTSLMYRLAHNSPAGSLPLKLDTLMMIKQRTWPELAGAS
jgi:hypothetical protein